MTFLQICQRLRQEAGLSGTGPSAVTGQTGEMQRVVDWALSGYHDIQDLHATWRFLRTDFSFSTIASIQEYTPTAVGYSDLAKWICDDIRIYSSISDESILEYLPWDDFRLGYMYGSSRTQEGRPSLCSVKPNNSLMLWQLPNAVLTVNGEYYKVTQTMTANSDIPLIPPQFHMAIVWKGLMHYAYYAAADEVYAHGETQFNEKYTALELDQLEDMGWGEPLA